MNRVKYSMLFGIALVCMMLFSACDNPLEPPKIETPMSGYGRISISLVEKETEPQTVRTVFPSTIFDKYVYTFTKEDEQNGVEKRTDEEGFFTLEIGNYTVEVQAYIGNAEPYTLAAIGVSELFNVGPGDNDPVQVILTGVDTVEHGEFSYTITYPVGAEAKITLQKWHNMSDITLIPNKLTEENGITETMALEAGPYLLSILISKTGLYAGISEVVYIYSSLSTIYTKNYTDNDFVPKLPGAAVSVPTLDNVTQNSITINPVNVSANRQAVEYGINTSSVAPTAWQTDTIFNGLSGGVYYIFARSAENDDYTVGMASASLPVMIVTTTGQWIDALTVIRNGGSGTAGNSKIYIIAVFGNVAVFGSTSTSTSFGSVQYIEVTLRGNGTLSLDSSGSILRLGSNQTLIIDDENLVLQGRSGNSYPVMYVQSSGRLELKSGAISGNNSSSSYGGGVYVATDGTFTMSGGTIFGNTAFSSSSNIYGGGGVYVSGTFTMNGGEISDNIASSSSSSSYSFGGGGVYVSGGTFIMSGGEISNNNAAHSSTPSSYSSSGGGGVYLSGGALTMSGGIISGNTTIFSGGGVYLSGGTFTMSGGIISGNISSSTGGGVEMDSNRPSSFTMTGGIVYGSDAETALANTAYPGAALFMYMFTERGTAKYGDGTNILPHTDGQSGYTNNTINLDYTISGTGTFTYDGTAKTVSVTRKENASPGAITVLYNGTETPPVNVGTYTVTFNVAAVPGFNAITGLPAGTITITKAAGTAVNAPTGTLSVTGTSITVNAVIAPTNGQTIEYARNTTNSAPSSGWQTDTTFTGLSGSTTYYIFARSAQNSNYETGAASGSLTVTTLPTVSTNRFEYYWVNEHDSLVTTSGGVTTINAGETLTITAQGTGYVVKQWLLNGKITGQIGNTYNFSSTTGGNHTVGLFVEKNGKLYNTNITITVVPYTVTFNANGGSGTPPVAQTGPITLPSGSGLSKTGYIFGGWNTMADGTGTNYNAGTNYTPSGNVTLYANWLHPLSAPTEVSATAISSIKININWSRVTEATYYEVYRSTDATGTYSRIVTTTGLSCENTGLTANTTYYYKVVATNSDGISTYSSYASATTLLSNFDNYIQLTEGNRADGSLTVTNHEQWFSFTATASTQYIHVRLRSLDNIDIEVYNSSSNAIYTGGSGSTSQGQVTTYRSGLTIGQVYYILVSPSISSSTGTFTILFNTNENTIIF